MWQIFCHWLTPHHTSINQSDWNFNFGSYMASQLRNNKKTAFLNKLAFDVWCVHKRRTTIRIIMIRSVVISGYPSVYLHWTTRFPLKIATTDRICLANDNHWATPIKVTQFQTAWVATLPIFYGSKFSPGCSTPRGYLLMTGGCTY
jgi:hypothetical protein